MLLNGETGEINTKRYYYCNSPYVNVEKSIIVNKEK
jgi:hypothetical protein